MMKKKPFEFAARIGAKPSKVRIDLKQGHVVTGLTDMDYFYRFTKPVPVKKGDVYKAVCGKGLILNGELVPRTIIQPKAKMPVKMGWAPRKLRMTVFLDRDRIWKPGTKSHGKTGKPYWSAVDTRGYWIGCGDTAQQAIARLIWQIRVIDDMHHEEASKGRRVIRWHVERSKGVRKELLEMEAKARKNGFILEGVDWRRCKMSRLLMK